MTKTNLLKCAVALLAATATTLFLFSAVAGLADHDRTLLLGARNSPTLVVTYRTGTAQPAARLPAIRPAAATL